MSEQWNGMPEAWMLLARVSKAEPGKVVTSACAGTRFSVTENEAKGDFLRYVFEQKPGFAIDELMCSPLIIPSSVLAAAREAGRREGAEAMRKDAVVACEVEADEWREVRNFEAVYVIKQCRDRIKTLPAPPQPQEPEGQGVEFYRVALKKIEALGESGGGSLGGYEAFKIAKDALSAKQEPQT